MYSFFNLCATLGGGGQRHTPVALPPGKRPGTHYIGGWVGPDQIWTVSKNLTPTGIRSPDGRAHSESLYRPRYSGAPSNLYNYSDTSANE
jgi:hypothetical protein